LNQNGSDTRREKIATPECIPIHEDVAIFSATT
jgi:hypothetical protein